MISFVKKSGICALLAAMLSAQLMLIPSPKAFAAETEFNVAAGQATVTTNGVVSNAVSLNLLVDGDRQTNNYALIGASTGPKWVQLDLGESHPITRVNVLNDFNSSATRSGRDIIVQLSNDPTFASGVTTIFNNDTDNTAGQGAGTDAVYMEPTDGSGKSIALGTPVNARYVRSWANGHTRTADSSIQTVNTPVELEVYTAIPETNSSHPISVNLTASSSTVNTAILSWNSPGPSAIAGYDIRFSTSPITSTNWNNGLVVKRVVGEPTPAAASSLQTMTVKGLPSGTTIYFAMKTIGADSQVSNLSTAASATTKPAVNIALGKTVTTNAPSPGNQPISALTDGVTARDKYVLYGVSDGPKWAQIDLGQAYDIARINIRNDWGVSGTYRYGKDIILQVSNDAAFASGVTTVFNNDLDNSSSLGTGTDAEYMELANGSGKDIFLADTIGARYVRFWANGHVRTNGTYNTSNTPIEIEVYADPQDATPPAAVSNLAIGYTTWKTVELSWTAPGNDGSTGTALSYDIRYSTSPITELNWASATQATSEPAPAVAGSTQTYTIAGLNPSTNYYFAMKSKDIVNTSSLSNVVSVTTLASDTSPPSAITDLQVVQPMNRSVKLTWTAPGSDGNWGTASSYDVRYSTSPITNANWATATQAEDELRQLASGSAMQFKVKELTLNTTYYFAIRTTDESGNVSALSNVVSATVVAPTQDAVTVTSLNDLQLAINNAPAGGRIITLAAGTYNQTSTISITGKNNITIQGATTDYNDTVVKGPGIRNSSMDINFKVNNSDYVTFKHMTIQDSYYHSIQVNDGSNYFHADHLKTWDNGEGGFKTTFNVNSGLGYNDYGIIENSVIGYSVSGIHSSVEGIDLIASKGWIIRGNHIENTKRAEGGGGYGVFAKANSIDTLIENNVFVNNFIALSFGGGGSGVAFFRNGDTTYEHRGGIMRNNVVYGTDDAGIYLNKATGFKIYNNTILNTGSGVGSIEPRYAESSGEIRNNLLSTAVKLRNGGTATQSNNITNAAPGWLVDPANGDFHLHPYFGSGARDIGTTLPEVPTDMDGDARPYGSAPDVGADEFVPAETTPPAAITNLTASNATARTVLLTWDAPGDDGNTGAAYAYDIRYANAAITDANWDSAQKVENEPVPQAAGTSQSYTLVGPTAGSTIYVAMKTADDQGNNSLLSNVASITTLSTSGSEFTPSDDVHVANSGARYSSSSPTLSIANNGNSTHWAYVKVDFTGYSGTTAEEAVLRIYTANKPGKQHQVTVTGLMDDSWIESTLTINNLPNETGAVNVGMIPLNLAGWYDLDLTSFINSQMADKIVSFKLHDPLAQASGVNFSSSENAYNRPILLVKSTDTVAPSAISNLSAGEKTLSSVVLKWTAPGDDGNSRTASGYDVRYSATPINESNWNAATPVVGEPSPQIAGTAQQFTVLGLTPGQTYYFAMKTRDNANNESGLSNVIQVDIETTINVALGKSVTYTGSISNGKLPSILTDGVKDRNEYILVGVGSGPKWVQVDLGRSYPISRINIRNDWGAGSDTYRSGRDHIVQVSSDPTFAAGVTTLFNNDTDNSTGLGAGTDAEYQEPADGSGKNIVPSSAINARYVRFWANGHVRVNQVVNLVNTPVEIEVYADPGDSIAPSAVSNLSSANTKWKSTTLSWTAPGNNGTTGTASSYDIRYHSAPITEDNWNDAVQISNEPTPLVAGTAQSLAVTNLTPGMTHYFAMRTFDEAVNASALSNVHAVTTPASDPTPPSAIADLQAVGPNIRSVQLTWTAPGNDGNLGKAASYDVRYSTSTITEANWATATQAEDELAQKDPGLAMKFQVNELETNTTYYFAVKTLDDAGNYSALSNVVSATTFTPTPDSVTVTSLTDLQQAINNAPVGGRIITLAAGTYNQTSSIVINSKNNITIQGATTNYADTVVAGPGINNSSMDINFKVNDSDYVTFKHLTIQDSYYHSIQVNSGSDYFHADHLKTWDNGEGGFKSTSGGNPELPYTDYGVIENSLIGYSVSGLRSSIEGIDLIASKGWVVRGNVFENAKGANNGIAYAFFAKGNSIDTIVENNVFKNNFIAMSFGGGGTGAQYFRNGDTTYEHRGGIMRNNVVYGTLDAGVYMNKATGFKVYNNTMLGIAPGVNVGGVESRYAESSGEVRNNLMDKAVKLRNGGTATQSNNISTASANWLIDAAGGNYHLNPVTASAAIDTGYSLPIDVPTDMDGQLRPSGTAYDIGADEKSTVPMAPTSVTASVYNGTIQLGWNASSGATGYNVKRATVSGGSFTTIASGSPSTLYADSTVTAGSTYYYKIVAVNGDGSSPDSTEVSITASVSAPTGLSATGSSGSAALSWTASTGATSYNVKRSTVNGGPYSTISSNVTAVTYTDTPLTNGITYYYVVSAVNGSSESADSSQVSATPSSGAALVRTGWTATASSITYPPSRSLDGDSSSRWTTSGSQLPGQYIQVNMGAAQTFNKIILDTGKFDYPSSYEVYVSSDGTSWGSAVASGTGNGTTETITFSTQTAQYIKVVQTGTSSAWWSVYEFNVYEP
jgi:parallel beta-helix repeat protein